MTTVDNKLQHKRAMPSSNRLQVGHDVALGKMDSLNSKIENILSPNNDPSIDTQSITNIDEAANIDEPANDVKSEEQTLTSKGGVEDITE